jgi:hypothetical protein
LIGPRVKTNEGKAGKIDIFKTFKFTHNWPSRISAQDIFYYAGYMSYFNTTEGRFPQKDDKFGNFEFMFKSKYPYKYQNKDGKNILGSFRTKGITKDKWRLSYQNAVPTDEIKYMDVNQRFYFKQFDSFSISSNKEKTCFYLVGTLQSARSSFGVLGGDVWPISGDETILFRKQMFLSASGKDVTKNFLVLGLSKNKELGLYEFACTENSRLKKLKTLGTEIEDFDYFTVAVDESQLTYQSVVLMTHGMPVSKDGGLSYSLIDFNNPDKASTLTLNIGPITDKLKESSYSNLIRVHHNPTTNQLDIIFDLTDYTFINLQTKVALSDSKLTLTNPTAHKYWKPFPSQDLDCQTTKDFIVCGMTTYTTNVPMPFKDDTLKPTSEMSSSILYFPKIDSASKFKTNGYVVYTDIFSRGSFATRNLMRADRTFTIKDYEDNKVLLFKSFYDNGEKIESSMIFKIDNPSNTIIDLEGVKITPETFLGFFPNFYSDQYAVQMKGRKVFEIPITSSEISTYVVAPIMFCLIVIFIVWVYKCMTKKMDDQINEVRDGFRPGNTLDETLVEEDDSENL